MATGEFVVLVDHDDRIEPDALARVDDALDADPTIDYLYTDEDKVAARRHGLRHVPQAGLVTRTAALAELLHPPVGAAAVAGRRGRRVPRRASTARRTTTSILRVTERARTVHHVPERAVPLVRHARLGGRRPGRQAVRAGGRPARRRRPHRAARDRRHRRAPARTPGHFRVRRRRSTGRRPVSVVDADGRDVAARCGASTARSSCEAVALARSSVTDVPATIEVIVVADPATPPDVVDDARRHRRCTRRRRRRPVQLLARAATRASPRRAGELVVLLNDDVLVEQPDWLDVMVGFFAEPDVGVVGARLLYADGTLQHGGILLNEQPLHIFHGFAGDDPGPFGLLEIDREVSAVTGACLAHAAARCGTSSAGCREDFAVAFNDLDYCLRVRATGRRVIWTPHATLYHFESQTRAADADQHEIDLLYERWGDELRHDPYGNPNFAPRQAVWLPGRASDVVRGAAAPPVRTGRGVTAASLDVVTSKATVPSARPSFGDLERRRPPRASRPPRPVARSISLQRDRELTVEQPDVARSSMRTVALVDGGAAAGRGRRCRRGRCGRPSRSPISRSSTGCADRRRSARSSTSTVSDSPGSRWRRVGARWRGAIRTPPIGAGARGVAAVGRRACPCEVLAEHADRLARLAVERRGGRGRARSPGRRPGARSRRRG